MKKVIRHNLWVGGIEVNDTHLTLDQADDLALQFLDDGYDPEDIAIGYVVIMEEE